MNRFWCKSAQVVSGQGHEAINFGVQKVKCQGHTKLKIDLEAWWSIILNPLGSVDLLVYTTCVFNAPAKG